MERGKEFRKKKQKKKTIEFWKKKLIFIEHFDLLLSNCEISEIIRIN